MAHVLHDMHLTMIAFGILMVLSGILITIVINSEADVKYLALAKVVRSTILSLFVPSFFMIIGISCLVWTTMPF